MTDQQPNALRLANDAMCRLPGNDGAEIAAELRRLHAAESVAVELAAQYAAERDELRAKLERLQAGGQGVEPIAKVCSFNDLGGEYELLSPPTYRPPVGALLYANPPAAPALVPLTLTEVPDVGMVPKMVKPFTPAQRRRLWDNSKEHHKDAANFTGFERIVTLVERARGINGLTVGGDGGEG